MRHQDIYRSKLISADEAVRHIASDNDVIVGHVRLRAPGLHVRVPHGGRPGGERAGVLLLTLKPYDFYMKPEMKGHFELATWFHAPGAREALSRGAGHGHLRAQHAPPRGPGPHLRAPARHLLRHLHPARPARLRLAVPGGHLREGHHRGRGPGGPRGQPAPAAHLRRHQVHVSEVDLFVEHDQEVPSLPAPRPVAHRPRPSAATSPSWCRTAPPSSWASAASPTPRPWRSRTRRTWACTPRCWWTP